MYVVKQTKMAKYILLMLTASLFMSCNKSMNKEWSEARNEKEIKGQQILKEARIALQKNEYAQARKAIDKLRKECDLALSAREEGILLMDSINLFESQKKFDEACTTSQSVNDSLAKDIDEFRQRIEFYKRKLSHDKTKEKSLK